MKQCCAEKIVEMQEYVQVSKWLKLLLAASPFILIIPNLDPTMNLSAAREFALEEICKIAAEKARGTLMQKVKLPDFADACKSADCLTVNYLSSMALQHSNRHLMQPEGYLWQQMAQSYAQAVQKGQCSEPVNGWMPWNW